MSGGQSPEVEAARREYLGRKLHREDLDADPFVQFDRWLRDAIDTGAKDATAMTLASAGADGYPSARTVLLKQHGPEGFVWFSDSRSRKGRELAENPRAELLFYWRDLDRQARIRGPVEPLPAAIADSYFHSRPQGSRFSAAASVQSSVIAGRRVLQERVAELRARYPAGDVPRPQAWIGYRLAPEAFEFWQGRENRQHDRFRFRREAGDWVIERLSP